VLTNKSFIEWANENLVVLIAHNELGHDPLEGDEKTGVQRGACPLYPGMTCRQHCDAAVDIDTTRDEDLTTVPFIELCPNSWLVPPGGAPVQIPEADQFVAGKVKALVAKMQKGLGASLSREDHAQIVNALGQAEAGTDEDEWNKALQALAGIASLAKEPPPSLRALLDKRLAAVEEGVRFAFEDAIEPGRRDDTPMATRIDAVRALHEAADVPVFGKKLPVVADMAAWLKKHAATTKGS
jgi:hypothetical protein